MGKVAASDVCRALAEDCSPDSGLVTGPRGTTLPEEIWLADAAMWVRATGRVVTGWRNGQHFLAQFGPISAGRIRRAYRAWKAAHT